MTKENCLKRGCIICKLLDLFAGWTFWLISLVCEQSAVDGCIQEIPGYDQFKNFQKQIYKLTLIVPETWNFLERDVFINKVNLFAVMWLAQSWLKVFLFCFFFFWFIVCHCLVVCVCVLMWRMFSNHTICFLLSFTRCIFYGKVFTDFTGYMYAAGIV